MKDHEGVETENADGLYVCGGVKGRAEQIVKERGGCLAINRLFILKDMGFKTTWKLIAVGLFGYEEIPTSITRLDTVNYLDSLLTNIGEQTDSIIALICEKDDVTRFEKLLRELANKDDSNIALQKRKWRVCLLKELLDNISRDPLQGMLELMKFWTSMGMPDKCPQIFPSSKDSVQEYFTPASYELNLDRNRKWLAEEIPKIIKSES